jgi:hypothetical protein
MPLVLLGERVSGGPADHVAIDNVAAARAVTAHLLELGRRRIAAIGCQRRSDSAAAHLRYRGYGWRSGTPAFQSNAALWCPPSPWTERAVPAPWNDCWRLGTLRMPFSATTT